MRMIPKALVAVVGAFLACQHAAGADPARPDLGSYAEDDLGQYHQCSDKPGGPSHCVVAFTAGGHTCRIVPTLAYAYCLDGDEGAVRLYGVKSTGAASVSTENVDDDTQDQSLPADHKLVLHAGGGYVECGAGDDGAASCQNAQGHGFNLSPGGNNTW